MVPDRPQTDQLGDLESTTLFICRNSVRLVPQVGYLGTQLGDLVKWVSDLVPRLAQLGTQLGDLVKWVSDLVPDRPQTGTQLGTWLEHLRTWLGHLRQASDRPQTDQTGTPRIPPNGRKVTISYGRLGGRPLETAVFRVFRGFQLLRPTPDRPQTGPQTDPRLVPDRPQTDPRLTPDWYPVGDLVKWVSDWYPVG